MRILVLNCGSASVKYELIETETGESLGRGVVERFHSYEEAVRGVIAGLHCSPDTIEAAGHRVVHGGERFSGAVLLDAALARELEEFNDLAPLHNPANLAGYHAARAVLPHCPHVAVFDTAFHQTVPPRAFLYGLPYEHYQRHHLRRYGFHGTSHRYVSLRYAEIHNRPPEDFRLITCHLGNGCSVCAVAHGRSVDSSMGFTPLEGLMMGTRPGDIDPGAVLHLMEKESLGIPQTRDLLNRRCGLRGLSGVSNDMRELLAAREEGNERARLAIDVFCYRVKRYIGAFYAVLNGADAVVFTGGIGENAAPVREQICDSLSALGILLDPAKNAAVRGREADVSAPGAATRVWVIPTREELLIARETRAVILSARPPAAP
jgi:acetate kinase